MNSEPVNGYKISLSNVSGDISGGITSGIISLPGNIIFGIIAFGPLGPEYTAQGILAGMYSSIFVGLCAALFGRTPGMISGPKAPISLVFSAVIAQFLVLLPLDTSHPAQVSTILTLAFMVVFLSGIIQMAFGLLHFGNLIKFISYPVIAGFLNGTAILIILSQIWTFLGIPKKQSLIDLGGAFYLIQPLNILIGAFTAVVMWNSPKIIKKFLALLLV